MVWLRNLFSSDFTKINNRIISEDNFELIIDRMNITYIEGDKKLKLECDWGPKNIIIIFLNREMMFWEAPYVELVINDYYKDKILNNIVQALNFDKLKVNFHPYSIE